MISLEKDDFDFVNYLIILNLENVNYENLNKLKIKIKFPTNEYKNDNDLAAYDNIKFLDMTKKEDVYEGIIEYISGMTDKKAIDTFHKLIGF